MAFRSLGLGGLTLACLALLAWAFPAFGQLPPSEVVSEYEVPQTPHLVQIPWTHDGQTLYFVLDTGSTYCVLNESVFPGLRESRSQAGTEHAGQNVIVMCDPPDISVGPIKFASLKQVVKSDLTMTSQVLGRPLAGIIGVDALRPFTVQFDFDDGHVRFLKSDAAPHEQWGVKVPLVFDATQRPTVRATLEGQPADFLADTGYSRDGFLPDWWVDRMAKSAKTIECETATLTGSSKFRLVRAKDLELSGIHHAGVLLSDSKFPKPGLGIGFFGQYVATFDFPNHALYLKKGKRFGTVTEHDMSGLHVLRSKDVVKVAIVDDRSPAALAGVKTDDEVLQVNELKSEGADLWDLRDELSSGDDKPIRLRLRRDGVIREVQFNLKKAI